MFLVEVLIMGLTLTLLFDMDLGLSLIFNHGVKAG